MTTIWQESGSNATGDLTFYSSLLVAGSAVLSSSTDFGRGGPYSVKCENGAGNTCIAIRDHVLADSGRRIGCWFRFAQFPGAGNAYILSARNASADQAVGIVISNIGTLRLATGSAGTVIGSAGATLSTGIWYHLTLCYVLTSTTVNEIRLYTDNDVSPSIAVSNATLNNVATRDLYLGWGPASGSNRILYFSMPWVDDSAALTNTGSVWVVNKKPAALNTNSFDTLGGSGANRYDRVSEVPLAEANYLQHAAATDVQENFTLQGVTVGDADLTDTTLLARTAWAWAKRGALTPCSLLAAAASSSVNPMTTLTITIPASTATGHSLFVQVTSRDHTAGTAYPTVMDNDTGGNTWTRIAESTDRVATLWWKRATGGTASKTITVTGCVGSCAGGVAVYQNAATSMTPYADLVVETNASGNETHAGFTPTYQGSALAFAVYNYGNDNAVTSVTAATAGALTHDWEQLSTGGSDCACVHAHLNGSDGPVAATGNITWVQPNGVTYSIAWSVLPESAVSAADLMDNGTETPISLTPTPALFTRLTDDSSYPSNAAGIGLRATGTDVDTYLYECGALLSYTLGAGEVAAVGSLALLGVGR